jgi:hypothetical protein
MYPMTAEEDLEQDRAWSAHKADLARRKTEAAALVLHDEFCLCGGVTYVECPAMAEYAALAQRVQHALAEVVD